MPLMKSYMRKSTGGKNSVRQSARILRRRARKSCFLYWLIYLTACLMVAMACVAPSAQGNPPVWVDLIISGIAVALFIWVVIWPIRGGGALRHHYLLRVRSLNGLYPQVFYLFILGLLLGYSSLFLCLRYLSWLPFNAGGGPGAKTSVAFSLIFAPLIEEVIFRGLIQYPLEKWIGPFFAVLASSILFAAAHLKPQVFPMYLADGILYGSAVYATRSIWAGVILHLFDNIVSILLDNSLQARGGIVMVVASHVNDFYWTVGAYIVLAFSALFIALVIKKILAVSHP